MRDIEASISRFSDTERSSGFRKAHDALRALWLLAHEDDPQIGLLRAQIKTLPKEAIEYIDRRASRLIRRLFPGDSADTGFLAWAEKAPGYKLLRALQVLTAEGGKLADRSRGRGKRSGAHLEPMIFGEVRGAGAKKRKGGRPSRDAQHELVMNLALDWTSATGNAPERGRSDRTGFGDLVHSVFQWLLPEEEAAGAAIYALRRHWSEVKKAQSVPSLRDFLLRHRSCLDCKWAGNPCERPDAFVCGLLNLSCASARTRGRECGPEGSLFELRRI